jgi:3-isopropylmalate/(R)-2-methylmalate dehydratase large subunit
MTAGRTMFEKIWQRHVVVDRDDGYTLLYVDRHLMHDGSAAGFAQLRAASGCGGPIAALPRPTTMC